MGSAAGDADGRADELQRGGMGGKIIFNLTREVRLRDGQRLVNYNENFAWRGFGQRVAQGQIARGKHILGEEDAQLPADLNGALNHGHSCNVESRRASFEFYFSTDSSGILMQ